MGNVKIKIKKIKPISEEDGNVNNTNQTTDNTKQATELIQQKNALEKQISDANVAFQQKKNQLENQILQIKQKLASIGDIANAKVDTVSESVLYIKEEYSNLSKKDALCELIKQAYDNIDTISYTLDTKGIDRLSRKIIEFVNFNGWHDNKDHWDEVKDCIIKYFNNGVVNYATKELKELLDILENTLRMTDNDFSWIFGKK